MSGATVSARTRRLAVFAIFGTAVIYLLIVMQVGGEAGVTFMADVGETLIAGVAAASCFWTATRFKPGEALRRYWMLIAIGVGFFTLGDLVWTFYEVVLGVDVPFPGIPDLLYLPEYAFAAVGVMSAALAYRRLFDIKRDTLFAALITGVLIVITWVTFLSEIVADVDTGFVERYLSAFYPLADLLLEVGPALAIAFIVRRLGRGKLAWPWWAVAAGFIVVAATDTAFAWLDWNGLYASGHIVDAGWMLGYSLIGIGASLQIDVQSAAPPLV